MVVLVPKPLPWGQMLASVQSSALPKWSAHSEQGKTSRWLLGKAGFLQGESQPGMAMGALLWVAMLYTNDK